MFASLFSKSKKDSSPDYGAFLMKLFILLVFALGLWFAYTIIHVILAFFVAAFLVMLFSPFLNWCNRHSIADWLGIVIVYLFLAGLVTLVFVSIVPIFVTQISGLIANIASWFNLIEQSYRANGVSALGLPGFLSKYLTSFDWNDLFVFIRSNIGSIGSSITSNLNNIASGGAGFISSIGSVLFSIATTFVFAFFMAIERTEIKKFFYDVLPVSASHYIQSRENAVMHRLASWTKGQLILSISMSVLVYIGLWILHAFGVVIENKATLALLAGLLESIPYFGPFLALLPALAIASSGGWISVLATFLLYIGLQQLEGQVLVPIIMSKSLDLSPFFVLFMMAIGASTAGVLGILLAVPIAAVIEIAVHDIIAWKRATHR